MSSRIKSYRARLAVFTPGAYPFHTGGAEVGISYLSRELSRLGYQVTVYLSERAQVGKPIERPSLLDRVRIVRYSGLNARFLFNLLFLVKSLRDLSRPDQRPALIVVNVPTLLSLACAYAAKRILRIPYLVIIHGPPDLILTQTLVRRLQCSLIANAARRTCVSIHLLDYFERGCRIVGGHAEVIPNGFDASEIARIDTQESKSAAGEILFVGSLTKRKDPFTLVRSFQIVSNELARVFLNIVGEGPLRDELERFSDEEGLGARVFFHRRLPRADLLELMSRCTVLVLPSLNEGTPTVVVDALALGKPVVATAVGGLPEIIHDGANGYLVHAGDAKQIANHLIAILTDESLRKELAANAKQSVAGFTWPEIAKRYSDLLTSMLGR